MDTDVRTWALTYAANGWPVLPLGGIRRETDGAFVCTCRDGRNCSRPGKHPTIRHGLLSATTNPLHIAEWFSEPRNVGVVTGIAFDVLDVDGDVGLASLARLWPTPLRQWPGPAAATGHGYHLLMQPTGRANTVGLLPGLDFRGLGGYVVVAPSLHWSGRRYEWIVARPLRPAPAWLQVMLH